MELTRELIQRSKSWTTMTKVRDVLHSACDLLEHFFQVDAGYFLYYRKETNKGMRYLWGFDTPKQNDLRAALYASEDFLPVLQSNQGYWMSVHETPLPWQQLLRREGIVNVAGWLITINDEVVGVFVLGRKTDTQDDLDIISLSMAHICLMVEMIIYRRSAEQASLRDPLTGLLNRRGLMAEVESALAEPHPNYTLVLMVLDVNDLKEINDTEGHLAGDAVLIQVGHLMQVGLAKYNAICSRYGGDEFVALLQLQTEEITTCTGEISSWFEQNSIGVSLGCAAFDRDGHDFETCFRVADQRMYEGKSG